MHVAAVGPDRDADPVRTFRTFTDDLHRLADWFARCGIKTVAMESTGVYWIPVFEILEQRGFEVMVVNARDAKPYADPGATYYEERYRQRVLGNLQRRAKSLGYVLHQADRDLSQVVVS